ncbi:shikimate kinase [Ornithinibacillus contaminans]|uniref:shikimate kinase n=1 Tax=Ornithinibacillus contaminans TaxID=694055 RepID=UPI00064E019D|nr:shikimate kinase [Ornithinibacillus contaminans]
MTKLYLIGFMGSGKTTLAKHISENFAIPYIDLDEAIEKRQGKKISVIFHEEGEAAFRKYETSALKEIANETIIATGGGVVEKEANIQWMKQTGIIIYIKTSLSEISRRLMDDTTRPLWKNGANHEREALYNRRKSMYASCADIVIDGTHLSLEKQAIQLLNLSGIKGSNGVKTSNN